MPEKLVPLQINIPASLMMRFENALSAERAKTGKRVTKRHIITGKIIDYVHKQEEGGRSHDNER